MKKLISLVLSVMLIFLSFCQMPFVAVAQPGKADAREIKLGKSISFSYEYEADLEDNNAYIAKFVPTETGYYEFNLTKLGNIRLNIFDSNSKSVGCTYWYDEYTGESLPYVAGKMTKGKTYYFVLGASRENSNYSGKVTLKRHSHSLVKNKVVSAITRYDYEFTSYPDTPVYMDGYVYDYCKRCNYEKKTQTIPYAKTVTLEKKSQTYDGKAKLTNAVVKDRTGKVISNKLYSLTYSFNGEKVRPVKVGEYSAVVRFYNDKEYGEKYYGFIAVPYRINPKGTSITRLVPTKKGFKVYWNKQTTETTGYQIRYSTKSNMQNAKVETISDNQRYGKSISNRLAGRKYYVQIRTFKNVKWNKTCYSSWSKVKSVTTKK